MNTIGQAISRTDGHAKVTGKALYSAEHPLPRMAHAVLVTSTIASGSIMSIDSAHAASMQGVLMIMTHLTAPKLPAGGKGGAGSPPAGRILNLLQDNRIYYNNQPIAVVVADTLEHAAAAAQQVRFTFKKDDVLVDFAIAKNNVFSPKKQKMKLPIPTEVISKRDGVAPRRWSMRSTARRWNITTRWNPMQRLRRGMAII